MKPTPTGLGAPTPGAPTPDGDGRDAAGLRPDVLLAGPRGRRLCLELADIAATAASNNPHQSEFGMARFHAAYALDPDRGQSVVLFGPGADAEPPTSSPGEVAALLEAVPLPTLTETDLLTALTATVNAARYWQKPDGDDVLAASTEMRGALHRLAQLLADSPHTQWWTAPLDPAGQWAVSFVDDPPRPPVQSRGAAETLKQWRLDVLEEERRAATDRPSDPAANFSGTWWSRPPSGLASSTRTMAGRGPVGLWLVEDRFGEEEATTEQLSVQAGARIFEIDSPGAWAQLCREHPLEVTASKQHDWYRTTGRTGAWVMPDWSCFRDKYDAVHLTMGGYLATAGVAIPVDAGCASVLAGWDPDATFWLSEASADTSTHQGWRQDQEATAWMLQGSRPRSLTTPVRSDWSLTHNGYRVSHEAVLLGTGDALWQRVCADVLCWKVKTRSGFTVDAPGPVSEGDRVNVTAALFGVKVVEPVEVVAVVDTPDRVGFSYRTLPGHPVSGEEAFIVHRVGDEVHVRIRSLTRAAPQQPWRALFPLLMLVQRLVRRRYLRALRQRSERTFFRRRETPSSWRILWGRITSCPRPCTPWPCAAADGARTDAPAAVVVATEAAAEEAAVAAAGERVLATPTVAAATPSPYAYFPPRSAEATAETSTQCGVGEGYPLVARAGQLPCLPELPAFAGGLPCLKHCAQPLVGFRGRGC